MVERVRAPLLFVAEMLRDARFAARGLRRDPLLTIVCVSSLALGFALTASTLAIVDAYSVRSMPYPDAGHLYRVRYGADGVAEPRGMSGLRWEDLTDVVEHADASTSGRFFTGEGVSIEELEGLAVTAGSRSVLGVRVVLGRPLLDEDFTPQAEPVVLIGQGLWRERFGEDPKVIGSTLRVRRQSAGDAIQTLRIVGILPSGFRYARAQLRGPLDLVVPSNTAARAYMVRLRDGVPVRDAERRITDAARAVASWLPPDWPGVQLESVHESYVAPIRPVLIAIGVTGALVLVIVVLNVAVLMLTRTLRRQREVAVRVALGAGRSHIARMLIAESALLCGLGLVAGIALAVAGLEILAPVIEARLGRDAPAGTSAIGVHATVVVVTSAVGLAIVLSLAAVPLLAPWQRRLGAVLRQSGRGGSDAPMARRARSVLIVGEVALSLMLLVGCGLMIRSVVKLLNADLGYRTSDIARARIAIPQHVYPTTESLAEFYQRFTRALAAQPALHVAIATTYPFYERPRELLETGDGQRTEAGVAAVSETYFDVVGIDLVRGRAFTNDDDLTASPIAIVSETLAESLWPAGDALGARIRTTDPSSQNARASAWRTVVGVVRDVRHTYADANHRDVYIPYLQAPDWFAPLYVRTAEPGGAWFDEVRALIGRIDPTVVTSGQLTRSDPMQVEVERQLAGPRFLMTVLTGFGAFGLVLAMIGIFGVTAYGLQQREREIAIRTAIGADRRAITGMIVREGGAVLVLGMIVGIAGSFAVGGILGNQLYGVAPTDPASLVAACMAIGAACLFASWWPARRAARVNPVEALSRE